MRSFIRRSTYIPRTPIDVVITDFDSTLTIEQPNTVPDEVWNALRAWKSQGNTLILATGRTLPYLVGPSGIDDPEKLRIFDRIVAENGAVMWDPHTDQVTLLAHPPSPLLVDQLRTALGSDLTVGYGCVSAPKTRTADIENVLGQATENFHRIFGTTSVMYVPKGISKLSGIKHVLRELSIHPSRCATVGDGENDHDMLNRSATPFGMTVAVQNAEPETQELAGYVTVSEKGYGVMELLSALLARNAHHRTRLSFLHRTHGTQQRVEAPDLTV